MIKSSYNSINKCFYLCTYLLNNTLTTPIYLLHLSPTQPITHQALTHARTPHNPNHQWLTEFLPTPTARLTTQALTPPLATFDQTPYRQPVGPRSELPLLGSVIRLDALPQSTSSISSGGGHCARSSYLGAAQCHKAPIPSSMPLPSDVALHNSLQPRRMASRVGPVHDEIFRDQCRCPVCADEGIPRNPPCPTSSPPAIHFFVKLPLPLASIESRPHSKFPTPNSQVPPHCLHRPGSRCRPPIAKHWHNTPPPPIMSLLVSAPPLPRPRAESSAQHVKFTSRGQVQAHSQSRFNTPSLDSSPRQLWTIYHRRGHVTMAGDHNSRWMHGLCLRCDT